MLLPVDQRRILGAFLRTRREALAPDSIADPAAVSRRRRTPGLRREEVAQRCGLSTAWYSWIEQGRDISLSAVSLARLSDALRLTTAERAYLFDLSRRRDPAPHHVEAQRGCVPAELRAVLQATAAPAYLMDRHWHALVWNDAAGHLFSSWFDSREACLLRYVFLDPGARDFICDWEDRARRVIAEFRADTARNPEDPVMKALVVDLLKDSPAFSRLWNSHAVLTREGGTRLFRHPVDGLLRYEQMTLVPAPFPDHRIVMLLPSTLPGA